MSSEREEDCKGGLKSLGTFKGGRKEGEGGVGRRLTFRKNQAERSYISSEGSGHTCRGKKEKKRGCGL